MKTQITLLMLLSILFCNSILAQQEVVPEKSDTVTADTPPE